MRKKSMQNGSNRGSGSGGGRHQRSNKYRGQNGGGENNSLARQKKHALTQKERFLGLARDALTNGDRVEAEYYYQHVEHYSRVVGDIMVKEQPRTQAEEEQPEPADASAPDAAKPDSASEEAAQGRANGGNGRAHQTQAESAGHEDGADMIPLPNTLFTEDAEGNRDLA